MSIDAMTDFLEGKLGNLVLNGIAYVGPTSGIVYVGLFSGAVADTLTVGGAAQGEVAAGGYARVAVQSGFTTAGVGTAFTNSGVINFPTASADWGTLSGVALFDALTNGNALLQGLLTTPKTVLAGDSAIFTSGQLVVTWL